MRTLTPVDMISKEEAARLNEEVKSRLSASVTAHDEFRRLSKQSHVVHIEMYTLYIPAELWGEKRKYGSVMMVSMSWYGKALVLAQRQ